MANYNAILMHIRHIYHHPCVSQCLTWANPVKKVLTSLVKDDFGKTAQCFQSNHQDGEETRLRVNFQTEMSEALNL